MPSSTIEELYVGVIVQTFCPPFLYLFVCDCFDINSDCINAKTRDENPTFFSSDTAQLKINSDPDPTLIRNEKEEYLY